LKTGDFLHPILRKIPIFEGKKQIVSSYVTVHLFEQRQRDFYSEIVRRNAKDTGVK
jgi:hypothetical protein